MLSRTKKLCSLSLAAIFVVSLTAAPTFAAPTEEPSYAYGSGQLTEENQSFSVSGAVVSPEISRDGFSITAPPPPPPPPPVPEVKVEDIKVTSSTVYQNDVTWAIQWPFPVGVPMSSDFGSRTSPCAGCSSDHHGIDLVPGDGTPVQAMSDGVVKKVDDMGNDDYGYYVVISYSIRGQKVEAIYGHLQRDSSSLKAGDVVKVGDKVGLVGSTGHSTGAHLHYELHVNGEIVDPMIWMPANVGTP